MCPVVTASGLVPGVVGAEAGPGRQGRVRRVRGLVEGEWSQPVERVKRETVVTDDKETGRGNPGERGLERDGDTVFPHTLFASVTKYPGSHSFWGELLPAPPLISLDHKDCVSALQAPQCLCQALRACWWTCRRGGWASGNLPPAPTPPHPLWFLHLLSAWACLYLSCIVPTKTFPIKANVSWNSFIFILSSKSPSYVCLL